MSSAKEKSEARRARILANTGTRLQVSIGDLDTLKPDEEKPKERPLAARRTKVTTSTDNLKEADAVVSNTDPTADPEVEDLDHFMHVKSKEELERIREKQRPLLAQPAGSPVPSSPSNSDKTTLSPPLTGESSDKKKSIKEVEQEIAHNTQQHDDSVLKKDKISSSKAKKEQQKKVKQNRPLPPLKPAQIMRLLRILMIICLGATIGHFSAIDNLVTINEMAMQIQGQGDPARYANAGGLEGEAFDPLKQTLSKTQGIHEEFAMYKGNAAKSDGTWVGWLQLKWKKNSEAVTSGTQIAWFACRILQPIVDRIFSPKLLGGAPAAKSNPLQMVMEFYTAVTEGLIDIVLTTLGDMSIYLLAMLGASMLTTEFTRDSHFFSTLLARAVTELSTLMILMNAQVSQLLDGGIGGGGTAIQNGGGGVEVQPGTAASEL